MEVFCEFNHSHPCPLELEFANIDESDNRFRVIRGARDLILGYGSVDCFQYRIKEYLAFKGKKNSFKKISICVPTVSVSVGVLLFYMRNFHEINRVHFQSKRSIVKSRILFKKRGRAFV